MTTPIIYRNFARNVFMWFQETETHDYYIHLVDGAVEICKLTKEESELLILLEPPKNTPEHCAKTWLKSTLSKSDRITRLLTAIRDGQPYPRIMGLDDVPEGDVEIEKATQADKMAVIATGAVKIMRKSGKAGKLPWSDDETAPPAPQKRPKRRSDDPNVVLLVDICKSLKIDPSDARRLIRKAGWAKPANGRWEWPKLNAVQVADDLKALIEADK